MKVKCIKNEKVCGSPFFVLGKNYNVYSMLVNNKDLYYGISRHNDEDLRFYSSFYFECIDKRKSRFWVGSCYPVHDKYQFIVSFPEMDWNFYDNLWEGHGEALGIFLDYKEMMDREFEDDTVTIKPTILDDEWIMCPECIDAWISTNVLDAIIVCPYCEKKEINPRWKK